MTRIPTTLSGRTLQRGRLMAQALLRADLRAALRARFTRAALRRSGPAAPAA